MCVCSKHEECKLLIILFPYQQPVWIYMSLPFAFVVSVKNMWLVFFWQASFFCQNGYGFS